MAAHLSDPDLRILDCTWHHASTNLDGRTQYRGRHLPGSVHFDIDHVADTASPLPHMLPNAADFAKKVGLLGVGDGDRVVVYDRLCGGSAAARVWWMFRVFGYDKVAMLDGGFGKWIKEKLPAEMSAVRPQPKSFTATFNPTLVRTMSQMQANLATGVEQVIDARGPGKFDGTQEDVFPFKKLGHIPNAVNIPWGDLIHPDTGAFIERRRAGGEIRAGRNRPSTSDRDHLRLGHHLLRGDARALPARPQDSRRLRRLLGGMGTGRGHAGGGRGSA